MEVGLLQTIIGGIGTGAIYALLGLSFVIVFGKLKICSYMHGDLAILAAYIGFTGFTVFLIDPFLSLIVIVPFYFFIGYFIQTVFMKPFMKLEVWQGRYQSQVMVTWGLAMCIMAMEYFLWTGTYRSIAVPYRNSTIIFGDLRLKIVHALAIGSVIIIYILLNIILKKTELGISFRACTDDRTTALLTGINYHKVCAIAFGLSSSIAVFSGLFYALINPITPAIGLVITFKGWVAVIISGMSSIGGVIVAGIIIGLVESLTSYYWVPALKEAVLFFALIVMLVIKPSGLFGSFEGRND